MSFLPTPSHIAWGALVGSVPEHRLNQVCSGEMRWCNTERGYSARGKVPPASESPPQEVPTVGQADVVCTTRLRGLPKHYERRAA